MRCLSVVICLLVFQISEYACAQSVDPLTGRLQMSVPLGSLQISDVAIPISIYHSGDALTVTEGSGSCGLGWNLAASGAVSRHVRGLPDDYNVVNDQRKGWLFDNNHLAVQNFTSASDDNLSICSDEVADWNFLEGRGYTKDTEPDIFYVNAPGLSVQFVFGSDGNPKLLSYEDVKITVLKDANQVITAFTVQTNTGMLYTFNLRDDIKRRAFTWWKWLTIAPAYFQSDYNRYLTELTFTSAWLLTSVQSLSTGTTATFSYTQGSEGISNRYYSRIKQAASNTADTLYYLQDKFTPRYLSQIALKDQLANITWNNGLVNKVVFGTPNNSTNQVEYQLVYQAMHSTSDPVEQKGYRSFLKEIKQTRNCISFPSHVFTYGLVDFAQEAVIAPWPTGYAQDWFGYFNSDFNNKNVPTIYYYSAQSNEKRLRTTQNGSATSTFTGTNRTPAVVGTQFGALQKIDWPTGGFTSIEYESHKYKETGITGDLTGGGVRVKKIISNGGEGAFGKSQQVYSAYRQTSVEYKYELSDLSSSGVLLYPPAYAFATGDSIIRTVNTMGEMPQVLYTQVKEIIAGNGWRIYEYDVPGTFPASSSGLWKATKSKIARASCPGGTFGNLKNGFYTFPFAPSTNYNFARGLLTKTSEFAETGALVRERTLQYTELTANPVTVKGLAFEKIGNTYHFGQYEMLTGRLKVLSSETVTEKSEEVASPSAQSTTTYTYVANMLQTVQTTHFDGSITQQKTLYAKNFVLPAPDNMNSVALKALNDSFRHGTIVEQSTKHTPVVGSQKTVSASLTTYRDFGSSKILPYYTYSFPPGGDHNDASVASNRFSFDSTEYILTGTLKEYDAHGNLINLYDNKRNKASYHYATGHGKPVATFTNAEAQQCIYSGFEQDTDFDLAPSPSSSPTETGWTGDYAFLLTPLPNKLVSSAATPIQKGEAKYRVSCWIKAAQATTITFKAMSGTTMQASVGVTSSVMNQWQYLEAELNMAAVSNSFTLEVVSSHTATVDDLVFMPKSARIALSTFTPFVGVTSTTDDRGFSAKVSYDEYGRPRDTFDRNRNLVKRTEYVYQKETPPVLKPTFTNNVGVVLQAGLPVTFTATDNCQPVTYTWTVFQNENTPLATGSASTLIYTFPNLGQYNVRLTVSNGYDAASYTETYCVSRTTLTPNLTVSQNTPGDATIEYSCNSLDNTKYFTATNLPSGNGIEKFFSWEVQQGASGPWIVIPTAEFPSTNPTLEYSSGGFNYTIRCTIKVVHLNGACVTEIFMGEGATSTTSVSRPITYVNNEPCQ